MCDEIIADLIAGDVLQPESHLYQKYQALQTDNKRVHFLLLDVLSKGTYGHLKVFTDAIVRSRQDALLPYLPDPSEEELEGVQTRGK